MSVFCTEMLGFSTEVWERPPAPEVPDPLKLLYELRPEVVQQVKGEPVTRTLSFLYADVRRTEVCRGASGVAPCRGALVRRRGMAGRK